MNKVRLLLLCGLVINFFSGTAFAVPATLTFQGHVTGADTTPMGGVVSVTFQLYSQQENGSALWSEELDITFDNGFYSVTLGDFSADDFEGDSLYLGVTLDGQDEFAPRVKITSVPYALRAEAADSVDGEVIAQDGLTVGSTPVIDGDGNWIGPDVANLDGNAINSHMEGLSSLGIGTVPGATLDVAGEVKIGETGASCSGDNEGAIRYHSSTQALEVCNGSEWVATGSGGDGGGVWTQAGDDIHFATGKVSVGTEDAHSALTVGGVISIQEVNSTPSVSGGFGKLYAKTGSGNFSDETVLLLQLEGANGSTDIEDSTSKHTPSFEGDGQISEADQKFGASSGYFDGNGDYIQVSDNTDDFSFASSQDFTIDFWANFSDSQPGTSCRGLFTNNIYTTNALALLDCEDGTVKLYSSGAPRISASMPSANQWHHYAVVRSGGSSIKLYVDGTQGGSTWSQGGAFVSGDLGMLIMTRQHSPTGSAMKGYLDEFRVTKGVALWESDFTPPEGPTEATGGVFYRNSQGVEVELTGNGSSSTVSLWGQEADDIFYEGGKVGIGTQTPVVSLDVSGAVRLGNVTADCTSEMGGVLRWTGDNLEVCNGSSWIQMLGSPLGSSQSQAGVSCLTILESGNTGDGVYWVDPNGGDTNDAVEAYCDMTSHGGGWTMFAKYKGNTGGVSRTEDAHNVSNMTVPEVTGPAKHTDALVNGIDWTEYWIEAVDDPARQIVCQTNFTVDWPKNANQVSGTTNGHNLEWCYRNTPQHGNQCMDLGNTNTYSVSPHEGGQGGHWIHNPAGGDLGGFSCGFQGSSEGNCTTDTYSVRQWVR